MYFPSKRDLWMTATIWLFAFLFIISPIIFPNLGVWMTPDFLDKQWIKIVLLVPIGFCLIWIWFKTGYTIAENHLTIRYGPIKKIDTISSIRKTRNPFIDPALSMNKIEINFSGLNTIAISPKNQTEFVRQLLKHNPHIKTDYHFDIHTKS